LNEDGWPSIIFILVNTSEDNTKTKELITWISPVRPKLESPVPKTSNAVKLILYIYIIIYNQGSCTC